MDRLLEEIYFLKQKQKALQGMLDTKYAALKAELQEAGLKKYSHEVEGAPVIVSLRTRTALKVLDAEALMEQITDPREFTLAVLKNVHLPKKCVQALEGMGVNTAENISAKKSTPYLEVRCSSDVEAQIRQQQKEYYQDLQRFTDDLRTSITDEAVAKIATIEPWFPQKKDTMEVPDASEVLE